MPIQRLQQTITSKYQRITAAVPPLFNLFAERWPLIDLILAPVLYSFIQAKRHSKTKAKREATIPIPYKIKGLDRYFRLNLSFLPGRFEESGAEQRFGGGKKEAFQRSSSPTSLNHISLSNVINL